MVPVPRLTQAAAIAATFLALAVWTWGGWPDVVMDFGRELYLAWRISEGDVLYRDVASVYGPLSPYVNAAWFRLFGVSLRTLALCNMAMLAAVGAVMSAIVHGGARAGGWTGTAGVLVFLPLCGFAQLVHAGSFNFVAPYSHEATHGFALAAAAVLSSLRLLQTGRARWAGAAGVLCGLALLTKPESFAAALGASAATVLLAWARPGPGPRRPLTLGAFLGGMLLPPAIAFALLATSLPASQAWTGVLGSWAYIGNRELLGLPYFAWSLGTADVPGNLAALIRAAALQIGVLGPVAGLALVARRRPRLATPLAIAAGLAVLIALAPNWRSGEWLHVARPLPLWALIAGGVSALSLARSRHDEAAFTRHGARLVLALFALLQLLRICLHARLYHYGFVLAVPAVFLVVAALVDWIPAAIDQRGGSGAVFRSASLAALAVAVAFHIGATQGWLAAKNSVVGEGPDRFRADIRGAYVNAALQGLAGLSRPGDTLVVLPEGVMLNYLLRLRTPSPYLTLLPTEVSLYGEDVLLRSLQRDPPALIALVHRETTEYGPRLFGRDYGLSIADWISAHYVRAGSAGDPALHPGSKFGVTALRRRTLPAAPR